MTSGKMPCRTGQRIGVAGSRSLQQAHQGDRQWIREKCRQRQPERRQARNCQRNRYHQPRPSVDSRSETEWIGHRHPFFADLDQKVSIRLQASRHKIAAAPQEVLLL
jgi:hypothetical protein